MKAVTPLQAAYSLFDHISDGVCFADAAGDVLYMNAAAERLLEAPRDGRILNNVCRLLCGRLEADGRVVADACPLRRPGPEPGVTFVGRHGPHRAYGWRDDAVRRSERWSDLRVRCLRVRDLPGLAPGEELHMILIEDASAESELERQREEWRKMIAHDLRAPLTSVYAGLRLLEELHPGPPEGSDDAKLIAASLPSCRRMLELLDLYLDVARLDAGAVKAAVAEVPLAPLIEEAIAGLAATAATRRIRVEKELPAGLSARADAALLRRVADNLLDNALKYNVEGGLVRVSARAAGDDVVLAFADAGRGIDEADLPFIFDRYFQADARRSGRTKGTGLGLAFCKQALAAMGGRIQASSRLGEGSEFLVTLPGVSSREPAARSDGRPG